MKIQNFKDLFGIKLILLFFIGIFLGVFAGIIEIAFGFALQNFLSSFHLLEERANLFQLPFDISPTVLLVILAFTQAGFNFLNATIPQIASEGFNRRVRYFITKNTLGSEIEAETLTIPEVSHILTNLTPKVALFASSITQFVIALITGITILIGLVYISFELMLISVLVLLMLNIPVFFFRGLINKYANNIHVYSEKFISKTFRDLKNIYFLRIIGTNLKELKEAMSLSNSIFVNYIYYLVGIVFNSTVPLFSGVLLIIVIVVVNAKNNFMSAALIVPFVYFLVRLSQNISRFGASVGYIQLTRPFLSDFLDTTWFFNADQKQLHHLRNKAAGNIVPHKLVVKNLTIGRKKALIQNVSCNINKGDFLLISGKSGKGKTTLLMTLIGIIPKLKGEILWNDKAIESLDIGFLKKHVGYSGPDPFLFDGTVEGNILYGVIDKDKARNNIRKALDMAQCSFVFQLENGLQHELREGGEGISVGQKQRLSVARALLREPKILFLDEATSNIDETTENTIFTSIHSAYPEMIIIAVSHRNSLKKFATQTIEL